MRFVSCFGFRAYQSHMNNNLKRLTLYVAGGFILVLGITLILAWWPDAVVLFRGMIGMVLAVGGLLILYSLQR